MPDRLLLRGGDVVDGTGAPRIRADVLVADGCIAAVGQVALGDDARDDARGDGTRVLDVTGHVVAPGFVDLHAHSDLALLRDPDHSAKLAQGVTTQVIGQDGIGYAPVDDDALALVARQIAAWNGALDPDDADWRTMGDFLARLDRGIPTHAAVLVPQGNLRLLTVGTKRRPADSAELDRMRGILRDALAAGAAGLSSGLTYTPGMYADADELAALCAEVAGAGRYWSVHTRGYGAGALGAYAEAIDIGRRSGCPVHLTHATMNFPANRGRASELLALVDAAADEGLDVTLDNYPYTAGATTLAALLPGWAHESGPDATLARLADPEARERMRAELEETGSDGAHGERVDWRTIRISGTGDPGLEDAVGATVADLAARTGASSTALALDLMRDDALRTGILMEVGDEANVRTIMRHPRHGAGSDGILVGARPHPRAWGTFPRYLGHYVRELGILSLEEAVRHLAGNGARRLGRSDRGIVRAGAVADLVVFDPATVGSEASYAEPRRAPTGIPYVLVGGEVAIDGGLRTGALAGRVLRRTV